MSGRKTIVEGVDFEDLCRNLRKLSIKVPPRGPGRKTEHIERYAICKFLATFAGSSLFEFPLRVENCERPDIVLIMPSGEVGIEIVEAVPENEAAVDALAKKKGYTNIRSIPTHRAGETKYSRQTRDRIARNQYPMPPAVGDVFERNWADAMIYFYIKKIQSFRKSGFKKFNQNWLLIDDNWRPSPKEEDESIAADFLFREFKNQGGVKVFDRVFVAGYRTMLHFWNESMDSIPVNDLWR